MIKLILECNSIDYDAYLNEVLQKAKEHPEMTGGIKLPKGTAAILNHMPKKAKNEMIAKAINSHSEAAIPRVQQLLYNVLGPVEIYSFHIDCGTLSKESVVMTSEIAHFNGAIYTQSILPKYYTEETAPRIFSGFEPRSYRLEDAQEFIRNQNEKNMQLLVARSISSNKQYIVENIARKLREMGMDIDIRNLRVLVK